MHRIDTSTATSDGLFTEGDPLVPTPATVVSADWLNAVQEELVNTLSAAGITPDKADNAQLAAALSALVLSKLDGKTTQADAGGTITVKDVAIGGNLGDLASARGQIGDNIRINAASDLNAYTKAGNWLFSDAAAETNFPTAGKGGELNCYVSTTAIFQFFTEFNNNRRYIRYGIPNSTWTNWIQFISVAQLGDGLRVTNGIISVPEYEGATASAAGTSGLVPPAAAGQHESFLTGGGEYKPALTKISDSVSLADSTTAASAKAVKAVYDRLEALRVSFLGVPRYWRSTTLPANHVWANGDLALFSDWPELENLYRSGGLEGMLLPYDAPPSTIAQYCGRWRLNASSPTGLYVPNLSERFINSTINTDAFGTANTAGVPNITGGWEDLHVSIVEVPALGQSGAIVANGVPFADSSLTTGGTGYVWNGINFDASRSSAVYGRSPTVMPASVNYPIIIYLGNHS